MGLGELIVGFAARIARVGLIPPDVQYRYSARGKSYSGYANPYRGWQTSHVLGGVQDEEHGHWGSFALRSSVPRSRGSDATTQCGPR